MASRRPPAWPADEHGDDAITASHDSGGRICTAFEPSPLRKPVDSTDSATV